MLPSIKLEYVSYFIAIILAINLTVCSASLGVDEEYHLEHDTENPADCTTIKYDCDDSSTKATGYFGGKMYKGDIDASILSRDIVDDENGNVKSKRSMFGLLGLATKRPQHHQMVGDLNFPVPKANFMPVRGKKIPFGSGEYFGIYHPEAYEGGRLIYAWEEE